MRFGCFCAAKGCGSKKTMLALERARRAGELAGVLHLGVLVARPTEPAAIELLLELAPAILGVLQRLLLDRLDLPRQPVVLLQHPGGERLHALLELCAAARPLLR